MLDSLACAACGDALRYHVDNGRCIKCDCAEFQNRRPWRAPRDGGYHPRQSVPEPTEPPSGPAGTSRSPL